LLRAWRGIEAPREGRFEIAIISGIHIHNKKLQAQRACRHLQVCDGLICALLA
jgi:hypothetical protein